MLKTFDPNDAAFADLLGLVAAFWPLVSFGKPEIGVFAYACALSTKVFK